MTRRRDGTIAAGGVDETAPALAEVAHGSGYADQAHLSRELRSWFGITPSALRRSTPLAAQLRSPGYATALF